MLKVTLKPVPKRPPLSAEYAQRARRKTDGEVVLACRIPDRAPGDATSVMFFNGRLWTYGSEAHYDSAFDYIESKSWEEIEVTF